MSRARRALLGLAIAAAYLALAPSHVVDGDGAEFSALGALGGVPHPPGYPAYLLWLRATAWLPLGTAAHRAALATAVLGIAAALVLAAACRAWGARALAADTAAAIFAGAPLVLRIHTQAEVFALNSLVVATVLLLAAERGPLRGMRRAIALGLVAGLGLANHFTCALAAPVGILGVIRGARESRWVAAPAAIGAFAVGLLPYAYLLAAPPSFAWGPIDGVGALVHHALRLDYGGPGAFAAHGEHVSAAADLRVLAAMLGRAWLWLPACAGAIFAVRACVRPTGETRAAWLALLATLLLCGPLLAARFDVQLTPTGVFVDERFLITATLVLAIPVAGALERLLARLPGVADRVPREAAVAIFAAAAIASLPYVARGHTPAVEQSARNLLLDLPPDAVALVADDDGVDYAQRVLGERADVALVMWPMIPVRAYRERVRARLGIDIPEGGDAKLSERVAEQLLARGRPVFVDGVEANILRDFPTVPYGLLFRVLPHGAALPPLADVLAQQKAIFGHFEFGYPTPGPADDYAAEVHEHYARPWWILATALDHGGMGDDAAFAFAMAHRLEPH